MPCSGCNTVMTLDKYESRVKNVLVIYSLLGLMVAHLQRGVIVNKWRFKIIDSDPVDAALFTVKLDSIKVDHGGENGQLNKSLRDAKEKKVGKLFFYPISSKTKCYLITVGNFFLLITIIIIINGSLDIYADSIRKV